MPFLCLPCISMSITNANYMFNNVCTSHLNVSGKMRYDTRHLARDQAAGYLALAKMVATSFVVRSVVPLPSLASTVAVGKPRRHCGIENYRRAMPASAIKAS